MGKDPYRVTGVYGADYDGEVEFAGFDVIFEECVC